MIDLELKTKRLILMIVFSVGFLSIIFYNIDILTSFLISFIFVYLFIPLIDLLERFKINRSLSSLVLTLLITFFFVNLLFFFLPKFIYSKLIAINFSEISLSIGENISIILKKINLSDDIIKNIQSKFFELSLNIFQSINSTILSHLKAFIRATTSLASLLVCPLIIFYSLRDWKYGKEILAQIPPVSYRESIANFLHSLDFYISRCLRGQLQVCIILGSFFSIGFYICGLKYSVFIGMCLGLLAFIPFIGPIIGFFIILFVSFSQFNDIVSVFRVISVVMIGQIIEGNFITPKIVGEKIGLHPVMIMFGLFISMSLFGLFGTFFALPITVFFKCVAVFFYDLYKKSDYYL